MVAPNIPVLMNLQEEAALPAQSPSLSVNQHKSAFEPPPSTPPPPPEPSLEDRVAELEAKLATLSHLLAHTRLLQQQEQSMGIRTPDPPSPTSSAVPPLESPYQPLRRRLSGVLFADGSSPTRSSPELFPVLHPPEPSQTTTCSSTDTSKTDAAILCQPQSTTTQQPELLHTDSEKEDEPKSVRQKWLDYLESFQESTHNVDVQMEEFVRVPSQLESLLTFGFNICMDSYLYVLTMLPVKFLWSIVLLLRSPFSQDDRYKFHRRHLYHMIQVFIIYIVYRFILMPISIGQLYHWIRGQAMLKLYVLIAIVEVFDRLMCSLGQDCLDSMYWNTTRRPRSMRMLVSVIVVLVYAMVHTMILFVHVATLNVAINSADHALLTLLISGNFAEIKSTVFKKYNKPNLFKITASDICERFKLALFFTLVLLLNVCQGMDWKMTVDYLTMCGIVWVSEMFADWIKHSFITKFNFIPSKVYPQYALLLAGDVTGIGHEGVNLDRSHAVVKRIGFAQIPLVCVMLRLVAEAVRYFAVPRTMLLLFAGAVWAVLFGIKLLLGSYLQRICTAKLEAAPELVKTPGKPKKKRD